MTTADHLDALVGSDGQNYSAAQKASAINTAHAFLGTADGDSDQKDVATAMLAQAILLNQKKSADEQLNISKLMSDDIRSLLAEDEESKTYKIIHHKKPRSTVEWRS